MSKRVALLTSIAVVLLLSSAGFLFAQRTHGSNSSGLFGNLEKSWLQDTTYRLTASCSCIKEMARPAGLEPATF